VIASPLLDELRAEFGAQASFEGRAIALCCWHAAFGSIGSSFLLTP